MSANTRHEVLERFRALTESGLSLIDNGQRTAYQIDEVLGALQRFKDNGPGAEKIDLEALSINLGRSTIDNDLRKHFQQCGILYVGETYFFKWHFQSSAKHPQGKLHRRYEEYLASIGLPPILDLDSVAWEPPYLMGLVPLLEHPLINYLKKPETPQEERGTRFGYYRWAKGRGTTVRDFLKIKDRDLWKWHSALSSGSVIHAAMYLPPRLRENPS